MGKQVLFFAAMVAATVLAGCTDDTEGPGGAALSYEGEEDGGHADKATCNGGAQLSGTGLVDQGQVMVFVVDGAGNQVFSGTYDDPIDLEGEVIEGQGGEWSLEIERMAGFDGSYAFSLVCA